MTDANAPRAASDTTSDAHRKEVLGERASSRPSSSNGPGGASSTSSASSASSSASLAPLVVRQRRALAAVSTVLALTIVGAAGGGYWLYHREAQSAGVLDARATRTESMLAEARVKSDDSLATSRRLDNQLATLTSKFADAQTQQQALEQLYQDLARNRDDWVMTDAEQTLSTANQQLQLTGNVQLALFALQNADSQLATADGPQVLIVRRAIAGDIDKLKSTPVLDLPGLALRLDQAIGKIDTVPLAGDTPAPMSASTASATQAPPVSASPLTAVYWKALWARITQSFGANASRIVQVRRIDPGTADAMLVAPQQAQYLRENVKLRLLSARLSLLSRNEATLNADLSAADDAIARYFDPSSPATETLRTTIADVRRAAQQVTIPTLDASLQALRQTKSRG